MKRIDENYGSHELGAGDDDGAGDAVWMELSPVRSSTGRVWSGCRNTFCFVDEMLRLIGLMLYCTDYIVEIRDM